jgi:hypothetical protein
VKKKRPLILAMKLNEKETFDDSLHSGQLVVTATPK